MKFADIFIAFVVVFIVLLIILPLGEVMMDILLTVNLSLSLIILFITLYVSEPLDFSIFPSMLLLTTLFRLALNISSTKLILGKGSAGKVIETFGNFVVQGNLVVGAVVFLIIIVVQFIVITKGAERVAEVAARFTLDAMPGKQMAIDADLNSGLIMKTRQGSEGMQSRWKPISTAQWTAQANLLKEMLLLVLSLPLSI